jgi:NhaC family Na+:H+ antiporter
MAGADLFEHIRHMTLTTGPAWAISMVFYSVLGMGLDPTPAGGSVDVIQALIVERFDPGFIHVLPPVLVVLLVLRRFPALPSLFAGVLMGALVALLQGETLATVLDAASGGYVSATGNAAVDDLLSRGGMMSMGSTVFLVLCAMSFGGVMERTSMLRTIAHRVLRLARTTGSLIATTVLTSFAMNVVAADQYISIVVPGRMYEAAYRDQGLHPKNLSRALEDGGTITSALIPWNTCGAFMSATLMVPTGAYLPYALLNILNPLISILYGFTGWTIAPATPDADADRPGSDGSARV